MNTSDGVDTRERILAEAEELWREGGTRALTMRAVAGRVGVTATALYRHFAGKKELVGELRARAERLLEGYLERALQGRTPRERLGLAGRAYLDFGLQQPRVYGILISTREPAEGAGLFLAERVRECMEERWLRPGDPEDVARTIRSLLHGLISLQLSDGLGLDEAGFRALYVRSMNRLFEGLGDTT
ncbi:MAG: TetR/AcrR family transcriptional regulator [Longimicrobiaceae bacterium]